MRLNFTGRLKIDKKHAIVRVNKDASGPYYELNLQLGSYKKLPKAALVFLEAYRKLEMMRFDIGTVASLIDLPLDKRRLSDFSSVAGIKFRVKVTNPDTDAAGLLLAEADGLKPDADDEGRISLIQIVGDEKMGQTPWELEFNPTDPDIPTLHVNEKIGGKQLADKAIFRALVMPAVVRQVFTQLVLHGVTDEIDHWSKLWSLMATEILKQPDVPKSSCDDGILGDPETEWVNNATNAFANKRQLVERFMAEFTGGST